MQAAIALALLVGGAHAFGSSNIEKLGKVCMNEAAWSPENDFEQHCFWVVSSAEDCSYWTHEIAAGTTEAAQICQGADSCTLCVQYVETKEECTDSNPMATYGITTCENRVEEGYEEYMAALNGCTGGSSTDMLYTIADKCCMDMASPCASYHNSMCNDPSSFNGYAEMATRCIAFLTSEDDCPTDGGDFFAFKYDAGSETSNMHCGGQDCWICVSDSFSNKEQCEAAAGFNVITERLTCGGKIGEYLERYGSFEAMCADAHGYVFLEEAASKCCGPTGGVSCPPLY